MSPLSEKSREIFEHIAYGHSYDQILNLNPGYTYQDIFFAAKEALSLQKELESQKRTHSRSRRSKGRKKKLSNETESSGSTACRQGKPWDKWENEQLIELFNKGLTLSIISQMHYRTIGSISSRLKKLGVIQD